MSEFERTTAIKNDRMMDEFPSAVTFAVDHNHGEEDDKPDDSTETAATIFFRFVHVVNTVGAATQLRSKLSDRRWQRASAGADDLVKNQ